MNIVITGLDKKASNHHSTCHIKKNVWHIACLKQCIMCLPIDSWFVDFLLLITLFTNAFMECTVCLYSNFHLLSFFIKLLLAFCVSVTFNHLKTAQTYEEPNSWTCCHLNTVTPYCMQSFTSFPFVFTWTKKYNKWFMLHMVCNGIFRLLL